MKFKNILLLYKRSAYRIYFQNRESSLKGRQSSLIDAEKERFKQAHDDHYQALRSISKTLLTNGIRFTECYRGRGIRFDKYDLILTVGGDGTFLEAARRATNQVIIGVNSAPKHSVGRYCVANANNFGRILKKLISGKFHVSKYHRLRLKVSGDRHQYDALNDILVCHQNPAVLCRYYLSVGHHKEEQRSSGIWISTPAGSSGAIKSAGGKLMNQFENNFQYLPREMYPGLHGHYQLKGGILSSRSKINIVSLMRRGMIFIDGAHQHLPFNYGMTLDVKVSPKSINTVHF